MNYSELVEGLIEINKQIRKNFGEKNKLAVSPVFYAIEFCTVSVDIGRGVGKTTFIKNHAKKGDLVIVANPTLKKLHYGSNTEYMVIDPSEMDKAKGQHFETIYIDEPGSVFMRSNDKKFEMYHQLVDPFLQEQTFVLLGR